MTKDCSHRSIVEYMLCIQKVPNLIPGTSRQIWKGPVLKSGDGLSTPPLVLCLGGMFLSSFLLDLCFLGMDLSGFAFTLPLYPGKPAL